MKLSLCPWESVRVKVSLTEVELHEAVLDYVEKLHGLHKLSEDYEQNLVLTPCIGQDVGGFDFIVSPSDETDGENVYEASWDHGLNPRRSGKDSLTEREAE